MSGRRGQVRSSMTIVFLGHADGCEAGKQGDGTCQWQREVPLRRRIGPKTAGGCAGAVRMRSLRVSHELIVTVVVAAVNCDYLFSRTPEGEISNYIMLASLEACHTLFVSLPL